MTIADAHSIAVVRTRLPYIDRRALSQAWFSALHVASDGAPKHGVRCPSQAAVVRSQAARTAHASAPVRTLPAAVQSARRSAAKRPGTSADVAARRAQRARTSATAARTDDPRSYPPFQTSLSVGIEGARVALLLRREGPTLHVIALCAPANVELVRRALACADAQLRCSGESVRASVRSTAEVRA